MSTVERCTELISFAHEENSHHSPACAGPDGHEVDCEANYIVGCGRCALESCARTIGTGFPGGQPIGKFFYVRRCRSKPAPALNGELHADLDEADFLAVFPLAGRGQGAADRNGYAMNEADRADYADLRRTSATGRSNHLKVGVKKVKLVFQPIMCIIGWLRHFRKGPGIPARRRGRTIHSPGRRDRA